MDMDPCWVPSAIMQTMGALIGIYLVIVVLAAQGVSKKNLFNVTLSLYIVLPIGMATIVLNFFWLLSLTGMGLPFLNSYQPPSSLLERASIMFFLFSLGVIFTDTILLYWWYKDAICRGK